MLTPFTARRRGRPALLALVLAAALGGCGTAGDAAPADVIAAASSSELFDSSQVHTIELIIDDDAYDSMLETYLADGEKTWIAASVVIDGTTVSEVGVRLKGNSSLRSISRETPRESVPWLVRLDKYVDGQSYGGVTSFAVRSNTTETSLNEAVALELIGLSGLTTQRAIATRFSVNGSDPALRLVIENPDEAWAEAEFESEGMLYRADADGDYSYRGDDPASYDGVFDQEAGEDDLTPLVDFLDFINNSDDDTFAAELPERLDVGSFATYLAVQDLVDNFDDISGPGNNSYLRYDSERGVFTVVSWDQNLSFGATAGAGGGRVPGGEERAGRPGAIPDDAMPDVMPDGAPPGPMPDGAIPGPMPDGAMPGVGMGRPGPGNVLAERFLADEDFAQLHSSALEELRSELIEDGTAAAVLDRWVALLTSDANDMVDGETVRTEAARIAAYL